MPRRTVSQRIGSLGHRVAAAKFERLGGWIVRNQEEDVGIDMEAELSDPDPSANFLKYQIKSFKGKSAARAIRLKNDFLRYAYECRLPVILVLVETQTGDGWFCWLQGCIEVERLQRSIYGEATHTSIAADWLSPIDSIANDQLKTIARGIHPVARATQIRDLIRFALETHDRELVGAANGLLLRYRKELSYFPVDLVVNEVLSIGGRIWERSGEMLYPSFCTCLPASTEITSRTGRFEESWCARTPIRARVSTCSASFMMNFPIV
jgi:hypothetical protein